MAAVILQTKGLTKTYGGIDANLDVDVALDEGDVTALIGPNGAGKSTFVGMVSGRTEATRGTVSFAGQDISALPAHKRIQLGIAYTFQITSIFSGLSVHANVALAAQRVAPKSDTLEVSVADALTRVDLDDRADQIAGDLSYGHQRLLEIAMGLAQNPRLFIFDEPTQGLAESEVAAFIGLVRELKADTTILLIEHNMDVVMQAADRIIVLDQGQVLATGTPDKIQNNAAVQAAYLGTDDA